MGTDEGVLQDGPLLHWHSLGGQGSESGGYPIVRDDVIRQLGDVVGSSVDSGQGLLTHLDRSTAAKSAETVAAVGHSRSAWTRRGALVATVAGAASLVAFTRPRDAAQRVQAAEVATGGSAEGATLRVAVQTDGVRALPAGTEGDVVLHCKAGVRSAQALAALRADYALREDDLKHLDGGILAWIENVDPSQPRY